MWGNLYFVGTKYVSNHLIDTGDGLILLDSGYAETLYLVLDNIRQLGFDPRDIKYIVHSHGHIDHIASTHGGVGLNSLSIKTIRHYNLPLSLQQDFLNGIDRLSGLHVDICIGNHPETVDTEAKGERIRAGETDAFVDPAAWQEFLSKRKQAAEAMMAKEQAENA